MYQVSVDDSNSMKSVSPQFQTLATGKKYLAAKYFSPYFKLRKNVRHK